MFATQRVDEVKATLEEVKKITEEDKMYRVEIVVNGQVVGLADRNMARAVAMAIKLKKIVDQVEEQLSRYKEEIKMLVKEEGVMARPVRLRIKGVGEVVVSAKEPSVKILDAKGLYEVLKEKFFETIAFRPKKVLLSMACDADSEEGKEVRKFLAVETKEDDIVRVTAKKQ